MKNAIIFLFSILLFACCKKDFEGIEIKGRITEVGSGKPVARAKIIIEGIGHSDGFLSPGSGNGFIVDSVFTDNDGNYIFSRNDNPASGYYLIITKDKYQRAEPSRGFNNDVKQTFDYQLQPYAWVKIHLKNVNPVNEWDRIKVLGFYDPGINCIYTGSNINVYRVEKIYGNKSNLISWYSTKNNITKRDTSLLKPPAQDTIPLDIFY